MKNKTTCNNAKLSSTFFLPLIALCVLFCLPAFAQTSLCLSGSITQTGAVNDILPTDTVIAPWTNETPRGLRSTQTIDNITAMRADLTHWAPIAFDSNGQISAANYDFVEFKLRSSIDNPPINVIAANGVSCGLSDFVNVQSNRWTHVQLPLASLGLIDQTAIGRLKLKSTIAGAFTLWISDVRLFSNAGSPPDFPPPDGPESPENPDDDQPPPPVNSSFAPWHLDPGVRGVIDNHLSSNKITLNANGQDQLDDTASFVAALSAVSSGGVVEIPPGTYYLSDTLRLMRDRQVLRGAGSDRTHLVFTNSLPFGIAITGQYPQTPVAVIDGENQGSTLLVESSSGITSGRYALLTDSASLHSQVISIVGQQLRQNGTQQLLLAHPLNSAFGASASLQVFDANEFSGVEALSLDVLSDNTHVGDMIHMRSTAHAWLRDVVSKRARQSHVFTRQTYHCEITGNTLLDATGHGDGKQGYGIDLANSTTGCLVENNTLGYLRHSILFNSSANGNIVAFNHSFSPRHTNFANGGPGDISFHSFTYANLVEGNVVERIHIGDASSVGGGNLIHRNCATSAPLTIDNSPNALQHLYSNAVYGSNEQLQNTIMPPVLPESPNARPYIQPGTTLFDEDGVNVSANAVAPSIINNWFRGQQWHVSAATPLSYYGSSYQPLLSGTITGLWRTDCAIPAVGQAAGL